ncbi:GNAT family N-acetyltransferase [Yoonia sp. MH D7]
MKIAPIQQHIHFTYALQAIGVKSFSGENDVQLMRKGPLLFGTGIPAEAAHHARNSMGRCAFCVLNTDSADVKPAGFRQIMTPASVAEIDLTQPLNPHGKWRNALQKAFNSPLKTMHRPFDAGRDTWVFAADKAQQKAKRFRAMPHAIAQMWPARDTLLSTASLHGTPVAAMLFLRHGAGATYQVGWANALGRQHNAHNMILSQAVDYLAKTGHLRLDLGTVDTVNAPDLARFKLRSGAQLRQLGGTWLALHPWRR